MPHLFLSYAHLDHERVFRLHAELEGSTGHYIWIDKDELRGGVEWERSIRRGIRDSYGVIFAVTRDFFTRPFIVANEIPWALERFADDGRARLFPLLLDSLEVVTASANGSHEARRALDAVLRYQYIDARDDDFPRVAAELAALLPEPVDGGHAFIVDWPRLPEFKGRDTLLLRLHERLNSGTGRVSAHAGVTGMGGVGKTQLAVEYAHRYRFHYPAGVYWINAAANWKGEVSALADRLRLAPADPQSPDRAGQMAAAFAAHLAEADGTAMIVLDNVENPADVVRREIGPKLTCADLRARLLITTRRADLPPGFEPLSVMTLENEPLTARAILQAARPDETDTAALDAICRALGYLPLALGLAAAALRKRPTLTPARFLDHLRSKGIDDVARAVKIQHGDLHVPAYYNFALGVALDWHWAQLAGDDDAHRNARALLVLAASYGEAAQIPVERLRLLSGLPDDPDDLERPFSDALAELRAASLVEDAGDQDIRLHPLVREYVREREPLFLFRLLGAVGRLVAAYRDPDVLYALGVARGFDALSADLRETRDAFAGRETEIILAPEGETLLGLNSLRGLFDLVGGHLHNWRPAGDPVLIVQVNREFAHHRFDDDLRDRCDAWLRTHPYPHFRTLDAYRFTPNSALRRILVGHLGGIVCLAVLPGARYAVSGSYDMMLRLWDLASGQSVRVFQAHSRTVNDVVPLPDGRRFLSGGTDGMIYLWDIGDDQPLRAYQTEGLIRTVALLPDGRSFVTGGYQARLRRWDIETGAHEDIMGSAENRAINHILPLPDGLHVLTGDEKGEMAVWNVQTKTLVRVITGHGGAVNELALLDDRHVVSACDDSTVRLWDWTTGKQLRIFSGHSNAVLGVVRIDRQRFLSASWDNTLRLWNLNEREPRRIYAGHGNAVRAVTAFNGGKAALSGSDDRTLRQWFVAPVDSVSSDEDSSLNAVFHSGAVSRVQGDAETAFSAGLDGRLVMWRVDSNRVISMVVNAHNDRSGVIDFCQVDTTRLLAGFDDRRIRLFMADKRVGSSWQERLLHTYDGHVSRVNAVLMVDDHRFVSASDDHTLRLWDLETGETLHVYGSPKTKRRLRTNAEGHTNAVRAVARIDSRRFVSSSSDQTLRVWDLETGETLHIYRGHKGRIKSVIMVDERRALSGSHDMTLHLWDVDTGATLAVLEGHTGKVNGLAQLDARHVVSVSHDNTARLWDIERAALIATLRLEETPTCICRLAAGRIFIGDNTGKVRALAVEL